MRNQVKKELIQQILNPLFMKKFFNSRIKRYFPKALAVDEVEIKLRKNFLNYESLSLEYKLKIKFNSSKRQKTIQGRLKRTKNCAFDNPRNHYLFLKYLRQKGFKKYLVKPLDYLEKYNLLLYENVPGTSFQTLLEKRETDIILNFVPSMAKLLYKIHHLPISNKTKFPLKTKNVENSEIRHWLYLLKKYYRPGLLPIKKVLKRMNYIKRNNFYLFDKVEEYGISHGDIHLGNFLRNGKKIKIIDFSDAYLYDYFDDIARFLVQLKSMSLFYLGKKHKRFYQKAKQLFLDSYFKKGINQDDKIKIRYFALRNLVQITANLIFLEKNKKSKRKIIEKLKLISQDYW